jgi:hypothetical protein
VTGLPIQAPLKRWRDPRGRHRGAGHLSRPQPTGASCVANNGETQLKRALTQGAGIVSNLSRSKRGAGLACSRCGNAMDEVVRIAPLPGEPGLIAYECPGCGYVTSVLSHPDGNQCRVGQRILIRSLRPMPAPASQSVFISPAAFKARFMTARISTGTDRDASGGAAKDGFPRARSPTISCDRRAARSKDS